VINIKKLCLLEFGGVIAWKCWRLFIPAPSSPDIETVTTETTALVQWGRSGGADWWS